MNILHLEASAGWGGQEIRILREAIGMRERGHTVVFAVMPGAILGIKAREKLFTVYELNFNRSAWPLTLFRLLFLIWKHRIELINTHSSLDSWIGGLAGRLARKKIIRTRHLSATVKKGWNSRFLYGTLADFVVTTCRAVIDPLSEQSGKEKKFFRSIPTGVDPKGIQIHGEAPFLKKGFTVGTACFMRSWKGIETFLQAADQLRDVQWVIIGGGHAEKYRKMAKEMNLDGVVHFTGHLDNPFPALAALDAFLLLSTANEGVSQALLQAAYLQKPLIATPVGGSCEVCIDGMTGIAVPPFAPEAVVMAVSTLKNDPLLCQKLGENAQVLVLKEFTFQKTVDAMEEVYQKCRSE